MNKPENLHIKLEYEEGMNSKRDIISSELDLVNIMKSIARYKFLRTEELRLKSKFYRDIKKILMDIKLLETTMPKVEIPKILRHPQERKEEIKTSLRPKGEEGLEEQLREIQRKLQALSH